MIGSSASQLALTAVLNEPIDRRITVCRKSVTAIENEELKNTHQLCVLLRKVLCSVSDDKAATPDQVRLSAELRDRVSKFDPRRLRAERAAGKAEDPGLLSSVSSGEAAADAPSGDEWDGAGPLSQEESFRLVDIDRHFSILDRGRWILRPGANVQDLLTQALDGRPFNTGQLKKLYDALKRNREAGGSCFNAGCVLFDELERVLIEQRVLKPDPAKQTYGQNLLQEL